MGPKQQKKSPTRSKSPKTKADAVNNLSDGPYHLLPLNEDEWKAFVTLLVPSVELDELYLDQLERSVKSGSRRRFTWFSKKDLIEQINEVTNKKIPPVKKLVPLPQPFINAMENAKIHLDNKEEIPDALLAQLVKSKLLYIKAIEKEKETARINRLAEKKAPLKIKKDKSPTGKKSPTKPKKTLTGPLPEIDKQTQLKRKEDLEDEEKLIDDEPIDGPNHYIILSGFYSSHFLDLIDEYSIPVDCLIKFKSNNQDLIKKFLNEIEEREALETNLKANLKITSKSTEKSSIDIESLSQERQSQLNKVKLELDKFWLGVNKTLEKPDNKPFLQHIARAKLNLKYDPKLKSWFELEARSEFSNQMYTELAEKLYSLVIQKRQYGFYINNLKLFSIPGAQKPLDYPNKEEQITHQELDNFYDIRYYNELASSLPHEYMSPAIILHCMIEHVVAIEEKRSFPENANENHKNTPLGLIHNLSNEAASHFAHMINNLALDDKDKIKLSNLLPVQQNQIIPDEPKKNSLNCSPYLINCNDEVGARLKGVIEDKTQKKTKRASKLPFDPNQVETEMLKKSIWSVFTGLPYISPKLSKERGARLQELLHFCTSQEITNADVDRAFKQFVFETMNLTDVNKKSLIKRIAQNIIIPWDDPYPNISTTLSEEQQLFLKSLNLIDAKKEFNEELKKKMNRISSASTSKSIRFHDNENDQKEVYSPVSSILKSRPSTKMSVQSVHFPDSFELNITEQLNEVTQPKTIDQVIDLINNTKKRDLNDWNLAEHYDPKVLVQVLQKVSYTHPYVDSYYNRRDHSIMLVFSNPFDEVTLSNHEEWNIKLHSNVGFRNYLEKIYDMIIEWTRDEEAKYQATLVSKEVEKFKLENTIEKISSAPNSRPSSSKKSSPSPKGKKKGDKDKDKDKAPTLDDVEYITDKFVGHNSLKAWKIERDKNITEMEKEKSLKKEKPKSPKGSNKSPKVSKSPVNDKKGRTNSAKSVGSKKGSKSPARSSPKRSPTREGSGKRKNSKLTGSTTQLTSTAPQITVQKANKFFVGYDVGNNMIYVKSFLSHMFPSNGALIKTERHLIKTSASILITTSVIKDGNTFSIHLVDPDELNKTKDSSIDETKPQINDQEQKTKNKIAKYTSFTGVFKDGISLSFSTISAVPKSIKKPQTQETINAATSMEQQIKEQQQLLAQQQLLSEEKAKKAAPKKGKKDSAMDALSAEIREEEPLKVRPWNQLNLSTPNGLTCNFLPETYAGVPTLEDYEPHKILIKQSYTVKCNEKATEHFKNYNAHVLKEKSRIIKSDGTVIKFMIDNTIQIYYANGTIYRKKNESVNTNINEFQDTSTESFRNIKKKETLITDQKYKASWSVITPNGNEYNINKDDGNNKQPLLIKHYPSIQANDAQTGEIMVSREDNLRLIFRTDGSSLTEYEDGTRITTFYSGGEVSTGIDSNFVFKKEKYVKIECPGFATTIFNCKTTECTLVFANGTFVQCDPMKNSFNYISNTGETIEIDSAGMVALLPRASNDNKNKFYFNQNSEIILEHQDEEGNKFKVNKIGRNYISTVNNSVNKNAIRKYKRHSPRFFVIHKDSSGTELLRFEDVSEYLSEVEIDPMTAIIRDNVQGYTNIMGTTILKPIKNCLTDAWLNEYDEKDTTPVGLRCRNLLSFPPRPEVKVPGAAFGTTIGRGLQIDVNSNKRIRNPPLTIAKRMEYRQLIEYHKLSEDVKLKLINGLRNYMIHIAERAENHRLLLTYDPRTEVERLTAYKILELARPDHLINADILMIYSKAINKNNLNDYGKNSKEISKVIGVSKVLKKAEKIKDELKKEKENKNAWKNAFVPLYFESDWGKDFLRTISNNNKQLNKDNNKLFLQNSANDFTQNSNEKSLDNQSKKRIYELKQQQFFDSKQLNNKKTALPPISSHETIDPNDNKKDDDYESYQQHFNHSERVNLKSLPNSIKTTRPNAVSNKLFSAIEEPVRRKVHTSIVQVSELNNKSLEKRRGIEVYPKYVKFGILREGFTYITDIRLTNVGIDVCRFKIKQPPSETGIKIIFKPGPLAAGISREISIMIIPIFKSNEDLIEQISPAIKKIKYFLEIITETDIIKLPLEFEVATAEEFRSMFHGNLEGGKENHVRILSVRPVEARKTIAKHLDLHPNQSVGLNNEFNLNDSYEVQDLDD